MITIVLYCQKRNLGQNNRPCYIYQDNLIFLFLVQSADSLEMSLIAILAPAVRCYWGVSHWHEASLTTVRILYRSFKNFGHIYFWTFKFWTKIHCNVLASQSWVKRGNCLIELGILCNNVYSCL